MPSDNLVLNPGSAGASVRTLTDASSETWPTAVVCYATTVSPGANVLAEVTPSAGLPVAQQGSWAVTANAGTNLNTSALALEAGGHLASVDAKLPALGQALGAASVPVVLTAAQIATLTVTTVNVSNFPGGFTAAQSGAWSVVANAGTNLNTSALALDTTVSGLQVAQGSTTSGEKGPLIQGAVTTAAPTYTPAQTSPLSLDTAGNLRVNVVTGGAGGGVVTQSTAANLNATVVGTGTFAVQAAQSGTWSVTVVDSIALSVSAAQSGSWTNTVQQSTASALNATVSGTGTFVVQASITSAIPAGTNLLGSIAEAPQIAAAFNGTTPVTPQYATFTISSPGTSTLVSAVAGKKVYLLSWGACANAAATMNFQSHTTTALATGIRYMTQFSTAGRAEARLGIFATATGEALDIVVGGTGPVSGEFTYVQF